MTFNEVLNQTIAMLQQHGRVSYHALKRQFALDDAVLADLKYKPIEVQQRLVETGVLVGERGEYRLAQPPASLQVPATIHAVLAARIDRLPPEEKHLLQTAAVIGTEVPLPLLQAIAELPEAALHLSLAHLQATEFLYDVYGNQLC